METAQNIVIEFRLTRKRVLGFLTVMFMAWHPGFLGGENLTLTTYYPAPYGGYVSVLTTGGTAAAPVNTLLSRDYGRTVVGSTTLTEKLSVGGNISATGSLSANSGLSQIYTVPGEGETIKLTGSNAIKMFIENINGSLRFVNNPWTAELFSVNQTGDLQIAGSFLNVCKVTQFTDGLVSYCGGSLNASKMYTIMSYGDNNDNDYRLNAVGTGYYIWLWGWLWVDTTVTVKSGHMLCCKFQTVS